MLRGRGGIGKFKTECSRCAATKRIQECAARSFDNRPSRCRGGCLGISSGGFPRSRERMFSKGCCGTDDRACEVEKFQRRHRARGGRPAESFSMALSASFFWRLDARGRIGIKDGGLWGGKWQPLHPPRLAWGPQRGIGRGYEKSSEEPGMTKQEPATGHAPNPTPTPISETDDSATPVKRSLDLAICCIIPRHLALCHHRHRPPTPSPQRAEPVSPATPTRPFFVFCIRPGNQLHTLCWVCLQGDKVARDGHCRQP